MFPLQTSTALYYALALALIYVGRRILEFRKAVRAIDNHPGYRSLIWQGANISIFLPYIPWLVAPGQNSLFLNKHQSYEKAGWDLIAYVTLFPIKTTLNVADAAAIKVITSSRPKFPKPVKLYEVLSFFGQNIVASEGDQWKKYRRISAPAFSDRNNKLVWDEATNTMCDLFNTLWKNKEAIEINHALDLTVPMALFIISAAGFGRSIFWENDESIPKGHQMSFKDALNIVSTNTIPKLILPDWAMGVTPSLRRVRLAFEELECYMKEMIRERLSSGHKYDRYDLFSSLLDANQDEHTGQLELTESELVGNIFVFLIAGHETTANTLCFALALLALHPEQQELLYRHIKSIIPDGKLPCYEDMPLLTHSMAVLYETLRMFPPVTGVPKVNAEDTVLTAGNANGETKAVPIPQGTEILIDLPGLHYNPRYWKDPEIFDPSRFLKEAEWPRDAFFPFSVGSRSCLGRKFFETESVAILTILVSRYTIHIKDELRYRNETFKERYDRILATRPGLTLNPVRVPLVFKRR